VKPGDLAKINKRFGNPVELWGKIGIVLGCYRYSNGTVHDVRIFLDGHTRLFDYYAVELINESR
jgi:hypothetical protein